MVMEQPAVNLAEDYASLVAQPWVTPAVRLRLAGERLNIASSASRACVAPEWRATLVSPSCTILSTACASSSSIPPSGKEIRRATPGIQSADQVRRLVGN